MMSKTTVTRLMLNSLSFAALFVASVAHAEFAVLVDQAVMVESNPSSGGSDPIEDPSIEPVEETGSATDASYVSTGGWAVTGVSFIDAATLIYDFNATTSVSQATLRLPIEAVYDQNGAAPVQLHYFSDENGFIEYTDYSIGFATAITTVDAFGMTQIDVDVTGPVNAALNTGRFIGFKLTSTIEPSSIDESTVPSWSGVKLFDDALLEFNSGTPPAVLGDTAKFDGYTLKVPNIEVATIGVVEAQFRLVDVNNLLFMLTEAAVTDPGGAPPALSGIELLNCDAFSQPPVGGVGAGTSTYAVNAGILDIPSINFNDEQIALRIEYIEGSDPWIYETLSLGAVQAGPSDSLISALGGGLIVEPSQDFVPLCHGWVLIGDSIRNRVVERNLLSGETGATYPFNTSPDQFTLDAVSGTVFMTVHPQSERLYKLDLNTGAVTWDRVTQTISNGFGSHTYSWSLYDLALGENGEVFALMEDEIKFNPENQLPFADSGLWMAWMDPDANFLMESIALEEPKRIEYDPVLDHVFLATESNLATFNFVPTAANPVQFITGTDVAVGSGCTDFSVSPDGSRLAYSCPEGNRVGTPDFSIVDMDPENYFNSDGEWFLGSSPKSAVFNDAGTLLVATDDVKLYVYDVVTHLILEDFELGLLEEESIRKIRVSKDGDLLYLFLENLDHVPSSKFYWMPMPDINGTPLP